MNKVIKFSIGLLLLSPGGLAAMDDPDDRDIDFGYQLDTQKEEEYTLDMQEAAKISFRDIEKEQYEQELLDAKEESKQFGRTLKWQNTLLTPGQWPVGIYVRDLIEGPKIAIDLAADILMYKNLLKRRVNTLYSHIVGQHQEILAVLEQVKQGQENYERVYEELTPIARYNTNKQALLDAALNPLRSYVSGKHTLVGYNPFTKNTILPIVLRFIWQKIGNGIVDGLLVDDTLDDRFFYAYEKNAAGKRVPIKIKTEAQNGTVEEDYLFPPPLSVTNIANLVLNPVRSSLANWRKSINTFFMSCLRRPMNLNVKPLVGIPSFISSPEFKFISELGAVAFAAQIFDQINSYYWQQYVVENKEKLLDILENYKQALSTLGKGSEEVSYWEQKIRKFIIRGHTPPSVMPGTMLRRWWDTLKGGQMKSFKYLSYVVVAGMCIKMLQVGYHLYSKYNTALTPEIENKSK